MPVAIKHGTELGEVLVNPLEVGDELLQARYHELLAAAAVLVPFDERAALRYARIRLDRSIHPPDAIQLACASEASADMFITNDERLSQKVIPGIEFLISLEKAFL